MFTAKWPTLLLLTCITAWYAALEATCTAADWVQWRGPQRDGQLVDARWPGRLEDSNLTLQWRVEMGPGYSGPIVTADRVFVTETRDEKEEVVRALDRRTGTTIWEKRWPGAMKVPFFAKRNGDWIRATPILSDGVLYVPGMRDVLVALDAVNGEERWRIDFVSQLGSPLPDFGFASSPLVVGDDLYVQAGASLVKLDKRTGKVIWRTLEDGGGMFGSAFSSPIFVDLGGRPQLVVQTRSHLAGVDVANGNVLWKQEIPTFRGMNILTPTVWKDAVFTSAYGGKSLLVRLTGDATAPLPAVAWENKAQGYMSSPVVIDNHVYLHLRNRRFTCIDLQSGKERWTTEPFGEYWSLVASGDRILALDERGELLLIRANPEQFELLGRRRVSDQETWGHLAIAGDEIFIRELNAISAWRWADSSNSANP